MRQTTTQTVEIEERILEAADRLFYRQGIQAIGVDAIANAARVSKRTLYRRYPSKDLLVAAYLQRRASNLISHEGDPCARVLRAFAGLERWFTSSRFHGCPFMNAICELGADPEHPGAAVATRLKAERQAWFEQAMREAGAADPTSLAEQLMIVFEGAIATALVHGGGAGIARSARKVAITLCEAAGLDCSPATNLQPGVQAPRAIASPRRRKS